MAIECCTCFEEIHEPSPFPCGHHMHEECIRKHLSKPECPMCRASLRDYLSPEILNHIRGHVQQTREPLINVISLVINNSPEVVLFPPSDEILNGLGRRIVFNLIEFVEQEFREQNESIFDNVD